MSRGTGLAFSCASSLCILPWSDGVVEPDIYKLPESSLGGIAATPDLVFVPTADSAIHFLEPSKHTGISELIRVGASTTSGTKISALLYRSSDGTLVFARGSKVYRQHIESNQLRSSFDVHTFLPTHTSYSLSLTLFRTLEVLSNVSRSTEAKAFLQQRPYLHPRPRRFTPIQLIKIAGLNSACPPRSSRLPCHCNSHPNHVALCSRCSKIRYSCTTPRSPMDHSDPSPFLRLRASI